MKQEGPEDLYRLSPSQAGILFHSLLAPEADVYFRQTTVALRGRVDAVAFEQAWQRVVDRHTILRTSFLWEGLEKPVQVVHRRVRLPLDRHDWTGLLPTDQQQRLEGFLAEDRARGFDLTVPPLLRVALFQLSDDLQHLVWTYHHLILDGWSVPLLTREVFDIYESLRQGREPVLADVRPYRLYIEWLQQRDLRRAEGFWRRTLAGFTAPTLLQIEAPPRRSEGGEPGYAERRTFLTPAATAALQDFGRRNGFTLNTLIQGAWAVVLGAWSGQNDVVFGTVSSARPADLENADQMIGVFINTLPVRVGLPPEESLLPWLVGLQKQLLDLREYDYSPLVEVRGWSEVPRGQELFESLLVFENYPLGESVQQGEPGAMEVGGAEFRTTTNYPMTLLVGTGSWLSLKLVFDRSRIDEIGALRLLGHLRQVLGSFPVSTGWLPSELDPLTSTERHQMLVEWNDTGAPKLASASLTELFDRQADRAPEAMAVIAGEERLSYGELRRRAERLALRLRSAGVGPEVLVGLYLERTADLPVGILGILKAGGAYVPLDPSYPRERVAFMLEDTGASFLVTQAWLRSALPVHDARTICIDTDLKLGGEISGGEVGGGLDPGHLAYVIYTSGSTGRPKGVAIEHRSVLALIRWAEDCFMDREVAGVLATTSVCFDLSVFELFVPLTRGGAVILVRDALDAAQAPPGMATLINTVPSVLSELLRTDGLPASVRTVNLAGEPLQRELVRRIYERETVERVWNLYGPSEDTTYSTGAVIPADGERVPIGRPISATRAYLLDRQGRLVPQGVPGELLLGGSGLARGYLGRPDLTAERFVPDSFGTDPGGRLYRTGDLARFTIDGQIEFLGRFDQQVKIRGFRIELGEIEAALLRHPQIAEAIAVASGQEGADRRLVAYVVGMGDAPATAELREFLRESLPDFMIPSAFLRLTELPRTSSGKVDRRALPTPGAPIRGAGQAYRTPRTPTQDVLAGIFSTVLGVERFGIDEDFFESGGHSLLATQVISRIRQALRIDLPLAAIFDAPTVARLAERIDQELRRGAGLLPAAIDRMPRDRDLPLSFSQERFWLADRLDPGRPNNLPFAVRLQGLLVAPSLERAMAEVFRRHEALRTRFVVVDEQPVQVIGPARDLPLPLLDLSELPSAERLLEAHSVVRREGWRHFDLEHGPLVRVCLLRLALEDHVLLFATHHIASDAWSLGVLTREVAALYEAFLNREESPLAELPIQYADFAAWQRRWLQGEVLDRHLAFWRGHLAASDPFLRLPIDPSQLVSWERHEGSRPLVLSRQLTQALRQLGRREGATMFMTFLAIFEVLLARISGQLRFNVGSPIAGRDLLEAEGLIGYFVNTLVVPADLTGDPSFRKLIRRVRDAALSSYAHQNLPYEKLLETLQPPREPGVNPLFQVMFALHSAPVGSGDLVVQGLRLGPFELPGDRQRFALHLEIELTDGPNGAGGLLRYRRGLFPEAWADRMVAQFVGLASQVIEKPDVPISFLDLATPAAAIDFNDDLECA